MCVQAREVLRQKLVKHPIIRLHLKIEKTFIDTPMVLPTQMSRNKQSLLVSRKKWGSRVNECVAGRDFILTDACCRRKKAIWHGRFNKLAKQTKASASSILSINTAAMKDIPCT